MSGPARADMDSLKENARAKVNLTLRVLGRRADGYHELESLVAFAETCDRLELAPGDGVSLAMYGPFAALLAGDDNLVTKAAGLVLEKCPGTRAGAFSLDKQLPVAAGLGGGSADAAAALRLLARANPGMIGSDAIHDIAGQLGADVTVCLESRVSLMGGRGDELTPVPGLPTLPAVLVNPGAALGAGDVYQALGAARLNTSATSRTVETSFGSSGDLVRHIRETGNDLQNAAMKLAPVISDVLKALEAAQGCLVAQMSGSGPTCFAIFNSGEEAGSAAKILAGTHPEWWVRKTKINS